MFDSPPPEQPLKRKLNSNPFSKWLFRLDHLEWGWRSRCSSSVKCECFVGNAMLCRHVERSWNICFSTLIDCLGIIAYFTLSVNFFSFFLILLKQRSFFPKITSTIYTYSKNIIIKFFSLNFCLCDQKIVKLHLHRMTS